MSKSLKKLIDINRLREFKNKLVGTDSAYVQTGAVDQTIAGTKTFSKPIAGSVTGSSGSCTGNAATATTATTAKSCTGNAATATTATTAKSCTGNAATATKLQTARTINGTSFDGTANITTANWGTARNISITDGTNTSTAVSVNGSANVSLNLPATIKANLTGNCSGSSGSCTGNAATATTATTAKSCTGNAATATTAATAQACTGNAATATKLATARSLWGNNFDGSAAITGPITGTPAIELVPAATTANNGGFIDFHYNQSTADYTSRIIESASGTLSINYVTITTGRVVTATTFNGALKGNVTGNCSGSSGSCTGNAATATKLATARTIALSGAATGTATAFDGSGNITIPVTALASSAIRAQWYAAYPDGAEAHNAMWGGRDITAAFNNGTFSTNVANGTFKDIFPGDYITKSVTISGTAYTVNWVVADCDYWINKGDTAMTAHHVVIVPQTPIFDTCMNNTNTTKGGYAGSEMYKNVIPACATGIVNAFGSSHILTFRDHLTRDLNTSAVSSGITVYTGAPNWNNNDEWYSQQCNLMSEAMVYDGPHCASSALDNTMATRQMSAFRLSGKLINYNRGWWWLRDVVSSTQFANVRGTGNANTSVASDLRGVRPFALLK